VKETKKFTQKFEGEISLKTLLNGPVETGRIILRCWLVFISQRRRRRRN
jgi:hypothetical protein